MHVNTRTNELKPYEHPHYLCLNEKLRRRENSQIQSMDLVDWIVPFDFGIPDFIDCTFQWLTQC
jgi:hypothetical protein